MSNPLVDQYRAVALQHPDCLLLMRVGDFWEAYDDNADALSFVILHPVLVCYDDPAIRTLSSSCDDGVRVCGFPHHMTENVIAKLITVGHRVAVYDHTQDPAGKRPEDVERDVREIHLSEQEQRTEDRCKDSVEWKRRLE